MKECEDCSRIDFNHFDSVALPARMSQETIAQQALKLQEMIAWTLALGSVFYVGVAMHPHWRFHDIRDAWDHGRDGVAEPADATRSHWPTHWRSMSVLCYGACASVLALEKALIAAYLFCF